MEPTALRILDSILKPRRSKVVQRLSQLSFSSSTVRSSAMARSQLNSCVCFSPWLAA